MFGRRKKETEADPASPQTQGTPEPAGEEAEATHPADMSASQTPADSGPAVAGQGASSSPVQKAPSMVPTKKPLRPEIPRRSPEAAKSRPPGSQGRQLTVGREITLSGEIRDCDHLVVEGSVEAAIKGAEKLTISEGGVFKGPAEVVDAEIRGLFSGDMTVTGRLQILPGGRVEGTLHYHELEIQAGGQITGQLDLLKTEEA